MQLESALLEMNQELSNDQLAQGQGILDYVKKHAVKGDADSVIEAMNKYHDEVERTMAVGQKKGKILDSTIQECDPTTAVELGGFYGYSAIRIGRGLKPDAKLYSIELSPAMVKISTELIEFAGLSEQVTVVQGSSTETLQRFQSNEFPITSFDFVFIDHWKTLYKSDLLLMEKLNLIKQGSVIVADNIIFPGAPAYAEYVRNSSKYKSTTFTVPVLSKPDIFDEMEKSIFLGSYK